MIPGGPRSSTVTTWIALVVVWLVWGSTYLGAAVLTESIPAFAGLTVRFGVAGLILLIYVAIRDRPTLRVTRPQLAVSAVMGLSFMTFSIGVTTLAVHYVPTGVAALLVSVLPVWIIIIRLIARDRPAWQTLVGVIIGLIGLAVMGENLALNIASRGYSIAVFNRTTSVTDAFTAGRSLLLPPTWSQLHSLVGRTVSDVLAVQRPIRKIEGRITIKADDFEFEFFDGDVYNAARRRAMRAIRGV